MEGRTGPPLDSASPHTGPHNPAIAMAFLGLLETNWRPQQGRDLLGSHVGGACPHSWEHSRDLSSQPGPRQTRHRREGRAQGWKKAVPGPQLQALLGGISWSGSRVGGEAHGPSVFLFPVKTGSSGGTGRDGAVGGSYPEFKVGGTPARPRGSQTTWKPQAVGWTGGSRRLAQLWPSSLEPSWHCCPSALDLTRGLGAPQLGRGRGGIGMWSGVCQVPPLVPAGALGCLSSGRSFCWEDGLL